ncbi:MAG TPA: UDP-N-acetylglucosamine 1-carboxyvinyltransferase [Ruminococcaceae bacterium]|nr:UDP-N-acetylglucosamine 1-carboxyvinyltransferase [Oscillospiraceae bacterium]
MEKFLICGGKRLYGEVEISGAKNAAVAILPATVLIDGVCRIENIPNISDVSITLKILKYLGSQIRYLNKNTIEIDNRSLGLHDVPHDLARHMRASYYFIGSLLGRFGIARVSMPGGCNFGVRPIDQHLKAFTSLGATVSPMENGMIEVVCDRLVGNSIYLDVVSVGATVNAILAAVKSRGVTIIENAAKEPHIVDLANFLNSAGADIRGAGTDVIKVCGVDLLYTTTYSIIPDQIEAGTYMATAAATGGDVLIRNVIPKHLESITAKLQEMGVDIEEYDEAVRVSRPNQLLHCNIKTMPHPGFPTDMQPQVSVLLSIAQGTSILTESVWDNRFRYVDELRRMGVQAQVDGKVAVFQGIDFLTAAPVKATDLRGGIAMVIAGLAARGVTEIEDIHHIERGYENIVEKLTNLGADIKRISVPDHIVSHAL